MATETRYIVAYVRPEGAIGSWTKKTFELTLTVTGSYHAMAEEAIAAIREQGYETNYIKEHASRRELLG